LVWKIAESDTEMADMVRRENEAETKEEHLVVPMIELYLNGGNHEQFKEQADAGEIIS